MHARKQAVIAITVLILLNLVVQVLLWRVPQ